MTIADGHYTTINWSLGGFLLGEYGGPHTPGDIVEGSFRINTGTETFAFTAEVVRIDAPPGTLAVRFTELAPGAVDQLDRALARRIFRRD